ncbi:hypothetical protein [Metallibacterium scheffleri]
MVRAQNKTPAQAARAKLAAAIKARGERGSNIWLVRPPFETRDLVLSSDPQVEAFYCLEGEPTFAEISYAPLWYQSMDCQPKTPPPHDFAHVSFTDGRAATVRLAFKSESGQHAEESLLTTVDGVILLTLDVLDAHAQRIENWRRITASIRRARLHSTSVLERQLALALSRGSRCTLRKVHDELPDANDALFIAAVATLLRRREILADVDSRPWSWNTQLWGSAT